jgi:hypothetical protein
MAKKSIKTSTPTSKTNTKKPKKGHSGNDDIAIGYYVKNIPRGVSKVRFYATLIRFIDEGIELPESWKIMLKWKNSKKSKVREDEFQSAINDSREGFNKIVRRRLERDLNK